MASQEDQGRHANANRQPHPEYKVGDLVYVNAKDFSLGKQSKSLSSKNLGPWKIIRNIDNKAYELEIPQHLKKAGLVPIFHPWKLHLAPSNAFPGQILSPQPPILIDTSGEEGPHEEWELLEVVDCRRSRGKTEYKATYVGPYEEWNANPPWQPASDFENSKDAILKFHRENPAKPKPPAMLTRLDVVDEEKTTSSGDDVIEGGG